MKRWIVCLLINLSAAYFTNAQTVTTIAVFKKPPVTIQTPPSLLPGVSRVADTTNPVRLYPAPFTIKASNYYTSTLGFFCKKEIQVEKALKFPVKFRIGDGRLDETFRQ